MRRRPTCYVDWREIWRGELQTLGSLVHLQMKRARRGEVIPTLSREIYKSFRRLERVDKRLDIENEVRDPTFYKALLDMIYSKEGDNSC